MFGARTQFVNHTTRVLRATDDAAYKTFKHGVFSIRKAAAQSLRKRRGASRPGSPPHIHRRRSLRSALFTAYSKEDGIVGPRFSFVGEAGRAHELGETFKKQTFPERPFMRPALEKNLGRFAKDWRGAIGE
jgi:phage gpG-like protein